MSILYRDSSTLIEHLKKGEEAAYVHLVNTYNRRLFVYALTLTNDHSTAKDIVQNVFIRTWEYRKRFTPDFSIQGFLYKCCYNEFVNQYRKDQHIIELERTYIEAIDEARDDANAELLEKKMAIVTQGISFLPKKCAEIFLLSKKDGLSNIEIAEYLDITLKTVEGHITRAYAIMREKLGTKIETLLFLLFGVERPTSFKKPTLKRFL